jgi:hypothetical protein
MSQNSYSVNLWACSQENAGPLSMQAQRSRPDQTHWQDVIAVNQNDPIKAVACTSPAARLEMDVFNHHLITVSRHSFALQYRRVYNS